MTAHEVISPELVLVDPELAARVRPTGAVTDCLAPRPRRPSAPPEPAVTAPPSIRRYRSRRPALRVRNAILVLSLSVNALLVPAILRHDSSTTGPVIRPITSSVPGIGTAASSSLGHGASAPALTSPAGLGAAISAQPGMTPATHTACAPSSPETGAGVCTNKARRPRPAATPSFGSLP